MSSVVGIPPLRAFTAASWLTAIPGFAGLWTTKVPQSHLTGTGARCICKTEIDLEVGQIAPCPEGCGRWFLRAEGSVRVKRFKEAS